MQPTPKRSPDAIVVLGCNLAPDGTPSPAALRRAERAARAYAELGPLTVVASGGRRWGDHAEADALADQLVSLGVPRQAILRELCSLSTLENAWYTRRLLGLAGLASAGAGIVTCDWHMPRARACFERMGLAVQPIPAVTPPAGPLERASRRVGEGARLLLGLGLSFGRVPR